MIFEYCGTRYAGTRVEIQVALRQELRYFSLIWDDGIWSLGLETFKGTALPEDIKEALIQAALAGVPQELKAWISENVIFIRNKDSGKLIKKVNIYDI